MPDSPNTPRSSLLVRRLLRCDSDADCLRIQKGHMMFKRLGKWSVLFTIGTTFFVSDCIAAILNHLQEVETITTSFLYRWTIGLFIPAPSPNVSLIGMWKIIDLAQMVIFLGMVIVSLRWAYADARASKATVITFPRLMGIAFVTNTVLYFGLRHFTRI